MPFGLRPVLFALLAAGVAGSAAVGVVSVVRGRFGETDVRLIATLIAIFLCAAAALASLALLERAQMRTIALLALLASPIELVAMVIPIWRFEGDGGGDLLQWLAAGFVWAVAGIFATSLRLLVVDPWVVRVMVPAVAAFAAAHAAVVTVLVFGEPWSDRNEDALARTIAVLAILMVAAFLVTPVVERLRAQRRPSA